MRERPKILAAIPVLSRRGKNVRASQPLAACRAGNVDQQMARWSNERMSASDAGRPVKPKPWLKYVALAGLALFTMTLLLAAGLNYVFERNSSRSELRIPAISGTVVDAMTGKPLSGMDVCLQASSVRWESRELLRSQAVRTDALGQFSLAPSTHGLDLFSHGTTYSVVISDFYEEPSYCGDLYHFSSAIAGGFWLWHPSATVKYTRPIYFPAINGPNVRVDETRSSAWNRRRAADLRFSVALIPLLQDADACQAIQDSALAGYCRDLNGSTRATRARHLIATGRE